MSYLVLARKWRPMLFDQVVNQQHVVVTLQNAIKNDRLANAYLFSGPRGVGKTTVARILAKAINCQTGPTTTPCNECASCTEITNGRSLEVFEIDGASNRGIDEVRNLRENLKYAASQGKYKIYIIDEVHMLTTEAFNALLKTLEEPPTKVMFIFATTEPHKIPATILSRCQRFDFKRIPLSAIIKQLKQICEKEKISIDEEALHLIGRKADGGMRDAQSLLDQAISFCGEKISGKEIGELLGIIDQEIYFKVTDILSAKDKNNALLLVDEIFLNGIDLNEFLIGLNDHFRNILFIKSTNTSDYLEISETYVNRYSQIIDVFSEEDLLRLIKISSDTEYIIKRSSNPRLALELAFVKMVNLDRTQKIDDLLNGINTIKDKMLDITSNNYKSSSPKNGEIEKKKIIKDEVEEKYSVKQQINEDNQEKDSAETEKEVKIEDIKNVWNDIIDDIKKEKIAIGSFLNEGFPSKIDGNTLYISFGLENGFHIKSIVKNYKVIENVLFKFTGAHLKFKCIKDDSNEALTQKQNQSHNDNYLDRVSKQVPNLKTILEVFDGELVQ